ncbi:MAG: tRNA epoxyqueuosine(34) reductase QueG, partial [Rikenellaceae bacterium]|nr:tRNA epoxyqueuosine(34) reductase QueG [Rikenellaceae bacterium]
MCERSVLQAQALALGFDACGVARCRPMHRVTDTLSRWIGMGLHAQLSYLERNRELQEDPSLLLEGAVSVIVCLMSYKTDREPGVRLPRIAAYARGADYHYVLKEKLSALARFLEQSVPGTRSRAFVDSAPIAEKSWAVEAGLGWIGRNSLLIHPQLGSMCFIGILLTTWVPKQYDSPFTENRCGSCENCRKACPSGAVRLDGLIDARACLSYHTIENRGEIPKHLLPLLGNRLFGCDACQECCPWNRTATLKNHPEFAPLPDLSVLSTEEWLRMGHGEFKSRFRHSPLFRT